MNYILPNDARFNHYRMQRDDLVEKENLFLVDGVLSVQRLIESDFPILEILCLEKYIPLLKELSDKRENLFDKVFIGTKQDLESIRGYDLHQGIMASSTVPNLQSIQLKTPMVILDKVLEANNIGSIIRSAAALGINNLLIDRSSCHPFIRRSVRVSMGNIFKMNIKRSFSIQSEIMELKNLGVKIYGASLNETANKKLTSIYDLQFPENSAIVLGNEAYGISKEVLELCDELIYIPMKNDVSSLNVAVSGAIFFSKLMSR